MRRSHGKRIADDLSHALKSAGVARLESKGMAPATVASLIATGNITRDRACDEKKRYVTYGYAIEVRDRVKLQLGKTHEIYACPWCGGFHLASVKEIAS